MTDQEQPKPRQTSGPVIHRAAWVIRGISSGPQGFALSPLADGAVLVADGMIQAVGPYSRIRKEFGHYPTRDHEGRVLAPPLINGHCHLELSHLNFVNRAQDTKIYTGDITDWIRDLLQERHAFLQRNAAAEKIILQQARQALEQMSAQGVIFIGDIGNSMVSSTIGSDQITRVFFLLELLGLTREAEKAAAARLENISADASLDFGCTPHAPYSTTPDLIQAMKKMADRQGNVISIHVAESEPEIELLESGTGAFKEFLLERDVWDRSFSFPAMHPVQYLDSLGVIDSKTICVHAVHVDTTGINILAKKKARVCLCPGSNRFLGVGKAPVQQFLDHGILPALGTDSRASNKTLNMWREMRLLREDHPGLPPEAVFAMATRGGAEAWGVAAEIGSLEPGKKSEILAVDMNEEIHTPDEVFEYLTTAGESAPIEWLDWK